MSSAAALFGSAPLLLAKGAADAKPAADALAGKATVAVYFSAHWCGPCRKFTPAFAEVYEAVKAKHGADAFEVVFVSADQDEDDFNSYRAEMPWLALSPFENEELTQKLQQSLKCEGFPTVVILDGATGRVMCDDAVQDIAQGGPGAFPWATPTVASALSADLKLVGGETTASGAATVGELRAKGVKHVALYFSAHWCPPCRAFTPHLAAVYAAMKASGRSDFEFIFVSSDRDEASFKEYHETMGFAALDFANRDAKNALSKALGVSGIPMLVTLSLDADGGATVINAKARGPAQSDAAGAEFPWAPKPRPAVVAFGPNEETFDCFDAPIAIVDLGAAADAAKVADVTAALTAAVAAAGGVKGAQLMIMPAADAKPRAKEQCPEGCTLVEMDGRDNAGCDACRERVGGKAYTCVKHDFDLCASCYEKAAQIPPPSRGLLGRIFSATKAEEPTEPSVMMFTGLKSRPAMKGRAAFTTAEAAVAFAAA